MRKRLLSIMLSVAMVLTMIPMTGSLAFAADTLITEATATMSLPVVGDDGSLITVSAPADANYTVEYAGAFLFEKPYPAVSAENPFQEGKLYGIKVRFIAKTGYYLDDSNTNYTINEQSTDNVGSHLRRICYTIPGVKTYNLTTQVNYGHGSISDSKPNCPENSSQTITFTPDDGYVLDEVTVNGFKASPSGNQLQVTMNGAKFVVATYRKIGTYHITTNVNGGHGKISDGERNLAANTTKTITFTPNSGYRVGKVLVNGEEVSVSNNSISVTVVDKDINIVVTYTKNVITEATATLSEPEAGEDGSRITVSAPADANYTVEYAGAFLAEDPYPAVSAENPFQAGKQYGIKVQFIPKGDYTFDSAADYTINGNSTSPVGDSGRLRRVWYTTPPAEDLSPSNVTISTTTYEYDGNAKTPSVTVKNASDTVLVEGKDYEVSYADNINAGTATATVTGKYKYSGTISKTFTITPQALDASKVSLSDSSLTYTGAAITPAVTVKDEASNTLIKDTDYTVSYTNNINPGTATVTITGIGNYSGTISKTFTITPQALSTSKVTLSNSSYSYTGGTKTPSVTVKDAAGTTLKKNTDYTVSYASGRKYVGTYKVTVTGKGNYSGTITKTFKINPPTTYITSLSKSKKAFTVKWKKKTSQVSGYQIMYARNSKFTSSKKTVTVSSYKTTSKKISNLSAKKKYYVKVRTYKTVKGVKYYSSWSKVKSVTTK